MVLMAMTTDVAPGPFNVTVARGHFFLVWLTMKRDGLYEL